MSGQWGLTCVRVTILEYRDPLHHTCLTLFELFYLLNVPVPAWESYGLISALFQRGKPEETVSHVPCCSVVVQVCTVLCAVHVCGTSRKLPQKVATRMRRLRPTATQYPFHGPMDGGGAWLLRRLANSQRRTKSRIECLSSTELLVAKTPPLEVK